MECGLARSRVEAALSRALRSGGASHGRSTIGVDVVGGNGFVSGRPVGVVDGVDTGFTGAVPPRVTILGYFDILSRIQNDSV